MAPTINRIVRIGYLVWSKALGKQRHFYQAGYSKGLEVTFQKSEEVQTFLWHMHDSTSQTHWIHSWLQLAFQGRDLAHCILSYDAYENTFADEKIIRL